MKDEPVFKFEASEKPNNDILIQSLFGMAREQFIEAICQGKYNDIIKGT